MSREKIAFVCQRYGLDVNGGSEASCRLTAEHLAEKYDVTVYTTCALDYMTWANYYPPGEEIIHGVRVKRYLVAAERVQADFDQITQTVLLDSSHTDAQEAEWVDAQGPFSPALIQALRDEHRQYRVVFFMTYLYYTSAAGLPLHLPNAALIPTVHDEPYVWLRYYDQVFSAANYLVWHTEEERNFALRRFPSIRKKPGLVIGMGIDAPTGELPDLPDALKGQPYLVYAGRIDENKGCREMFSWFIRYRKLSGTPIKLALMGKPVLPIPQHPDIIHLGFVSDEMKYAVMSQALALVLFSKYESFSIVLLESMMMGRPVLVNGQCAVLKEHCVRSNAGLYFNNYAEFALETDYLLNHPEIYEQMCLNGRKYVSENYQWPAIVEKYTQVIQSFPETTH